MSLIPYRKTKIPTLYCFGLGELLLHYFSGPLRELLGLDVILNVLTHNSVHLFKRCTALFWCTSSWLGLKLYKPLEGFAVRYERMDGCNNEQDRYAVLKTVAPVLVGVLYKMNIYLSTSLTVAV